MSVLENEALYFSMTVIPERLESHFFKTVIQNLYRQKQPFTKIIINIPMLYKRADSQYTIPEWLYEEKNVIINRCDDIGPATKLLGYYDTFNDNDIICVVDDDIIYRPEMLKNLYSLHLENPDCLITTFQDEDGSPTGFSGYLFKKKYLKITEEDINYLMSCCYYVDDTWVGKICREKGVKILSFSDNWLASMDQQATDRHPAWFELNSHTKREKHIACCLKNRTTKWPGWVSRITGILR